MDLKKLSDSQVLKNSEESPWMFGVLVDRYERAFLRKSLYILRSREDAEDAVQETFIKIYKNASKFSKCRNASFRSWAYKILVNTSNTKLSRKILEGQRTQMMDFSSLDMETGVEFYTDNNSVSLVQSILSRLPQKLSRLLTLYFFEERSYEEIACIEHLSLSAVRSRLHRARKHFKAIGAKLI